MTTPLPPWVVLVLGLAGGLGAVTRYLATEAVARVVTARTARRTDRGPTDGGPWWVTLPVATVGINVVGSLVLGLLTGLLAGHVMDPRLEVVLGAGFCGGFTTFGTASVDTLRLARRGESLLALVNGLGTTVLALAGAGLGWWLGASLGS